MSRFTTTLSLCAIRQKATNTTCSLGKGATNIINILHTISSVGPASFGLGPVALNLVKDQNVLGYDSRIWCLDNEADIGWASSTSGLPKCRIHAFPRSRPRLLGHSFPMEGAARGTEGSRISVIHQHGIWTGVSRVSNMIRSRNGTPTVITPHGSLQAWALKKSWWKKRLALAFYEYRNLHESSCLHAVAEPEISDCRNFGLSNPVAVIPNGISEEWMNSEGDAERFRRQYGISPDRRILLFLSRITPKKGLPMLLQAINSIKGTFNDWVLVIAGSDEFAHQKEVEALVERFGLKGSVIFSGSLFNHSKRDAFEAADLFVLPSYSEGAPIVILEALAAGVPVIATKASPWEDLHSYECGWLVDIDANAIAEALEDAIGKGPDELLKMGLRGKGLVASKYTWIRSAQMTIDLYEWLLRRRDRPDFIVMD